MKSVVRFTLAQKVFYNLMFVLLIVAGAFAFFELPVERYPLVQFGKVVISAYFPGASPSDVEALVTRKIEDALEDLEDVEFIRSSSYQERCSLVVKFIDDTDYDSLYKDLRFKILGILSDLPDDVEPPVFNMIETADWLPVVNLNLVGDRENRALTLMAEEMKVPLRQIPGVMEVKLQGEYVREFHVYLDPAKMSALGVTFDDAANAISSANLSIPAGDFKDGAGEVMVVVDERFRTREQVVSTVIRSDLDGSLVTVDDVISQAKLSHRDPIVISTVNGKDCVTLQVLKTEDGNALEIAARVKDIVENFRPSLTGQGVEVVLTQDSTVYINESISTLGWNMLLGITLVSVIIWYFMGLRNAGLATVGIPFSFLVTMLLMHLTGNSLNEITLFSFVLVSGIIVDDAILVLENIFRHVQEGSKLKDSVINGTSEVMLPVIAATSTTVAAFLPMLIMTGSTGEFFALIPKAVSFAIIASLIECLFILPLHYLDFGPKPKDPEASAKEHKDNAVLRFFRAITHRVTRVTFKFRVTSILTVVAVFAVCLVILGVSASGKIPIIKIKFFPDDYHLYYAVLEGPMSATSGEISEKLKEMSRFVIKDGPGIAESAAAFSGFYITEDYQNVYGHNVGMVMVTLPPKKDQEFGDAMEHLEHMRGRLKKEFEKGGFTVLVRAEKDAPPSGKDINVRVMGPDFGSVGALAREVMDFMRNDPKIGPYLVELKDDSGRPGPVFRFRVRQDKTREYGLEPAQVAKLAASILDGRFVGKFRVADEEVDLKLRVAHAFLKSPEDALDIPLVEHPSGPVRLGDLCEVHAYTEPGQINRYQGERAVTLTANIRPGAPTSTPAVVSRISEHYQAIKDKHPGAGLSFAGEFESTQRSFTSLTYAFAVAVLLIYLILATQFQSYLQPLIILSAIVFSLIGVVFGKLITQSLFTINSFIAVVGVTGVVVNDSLVLVDFINRAYRSGMSRKQAIEEGIRVRLRPILLTTLTTTLGLLPMALGIPSYSVIWGTMASTFVTGLATATALTLFIVPVEWDLLEGLKLRIAKRKEEKKNKG